jgi:hypothetical protein
MIDRASGSSRGKRPPWRKATSCQGGECVEVRPEGDGVSIRSSRSPADVIRLTIAEWRAFEHGMRAGEFTDIGQ